MKTKNNSYMKIDFLGCIYIKDIISYYDKPLVFSCISDFGQLFIACCTDLEHIEKWMFLPLTHARLMQVLKGSITAYEAFTKPEGEFLWKITIESNDYGTGRAQQTFPNEISNDDLPDQDIVYDIFGEEEFSIKNEDQPQIQKDSIVERREIFDISLEPKDSHVHEIDVSILGKVLDSTQNIINLIAYKQGANAKVPKYIREKNKLNAAGNYAASFGVRLKSNDLANILNESEMQENLTIFMNILEAKSKTEKLMEIFKDLNPAVSIQYKNLLKLLSKEEISLKTYCAFPNNTSRKISFGLVEIQNSLKALEEDVKEFVKEQVLLGSIVAVDTTSRTFGFVTIDDEKIRGVIGDGVNIDQYILPKSARIKVEITSKLNDLMSKENIKYKLLELHYVNNTTDTDDERALEADSTS